MITHQIQLQQERLNSFDFSTMTNEEKIQRFEELIELGSKLGISKEEKELYNLYLKELPYLTVKK